MNNSVVYSWTSSTSYHFNTVFFAYALFQARETMQFGATQTAWTPNIFQAWHMMPQFLPTKDLGTPDIFRLSSTYPTYSAHRLLSVQVASRPLRATPSSADAWRCPSSRPSRCGWAWGDPICRSPNGGRIGCPRDRVVWFLDFLVLFCGEAT